MKSSCKHGPRGVKMEPRIFSSVFSQADEIIEKNPCLLLGDNGQHKNTVDTISPRG